VRRVREVRTPRTPRTPRTQSRWLIPCTSKSPDKFNVQKEIA